MISQKCPRCRSNRIRRGYRPTRFWSKLMFRYNLLCNACNWEFKGFAVPGTVSVKPARKHKKQVKADEIQNLEADVKEEVNIEKANVVENVESNAEETLENLAAEKEPEVAEKAVSSNRIRVKKKVKIRQS